MPIITAFFFSIRQRSTAKRQWLKCCLEISSQERRHLSLTSALRDMAFRPDKAGAAASPFAVPAQTNLSLLDNVLPNWRHFRNRRFPRTQQRACPKCSTDSDRVSKPDLYIL